MTQRTVLITGGMGGIGTPMCQHLHSQGFKVATTYVHDSGREERWLKQQREAGYDGLRAYFCDVSKYEDCQKLFERTTADYGTIDCLVNMAGVTSDAVFAKMEPEAWETVIRTNLISVFNVTRQYIGPMTENGFGRIVNISSVNAAKGQFGQTNYSAAKSGMHGFTKSLAQEVVRKGVTVNTVSPGYVGTDMVMRIREDVREKIRESIPMRRFAEPTEIARAVAFLLDDNAGYITGSEIAVNGGLHMH